MSFKRRPMKKTTRDNRETEMTTEIIEQVRNQLRRVQYPGFEGNIVSMGFIKEIRMEESGVTIEFSPNTRDEKKVLKMEKNIREELSGLDKTGEVKITRSVPFAEETKAQEQTSPEPPDGYPGGENGGQGSGASDSKLRRSDIAPGAGYGDGGPEPFGGPDTNLLKASAERYDGPMRVMQWEVDPTDSSFESGEANTAQGDWEFHIWWQIHPSRLVYASIQALREDWADHTGEARPHPVGRSEAVNLVYDLDRKAVVAIYGTVRDFRPFVEAFTEGFAP